MRRDGMGGDALRLHVWTGAKGNIPHILDDHPIDAAFNESVGIVQRLIDDGLHPIAGIPRRTRQGPEMYHANDRL
jgi:hypothetical protein